LARPNLALIFASLCATLLGHMSVAVAASALNSRFAAGQPSNLLREAGVLVHTLDMADDLPLEERQSRFNIRAYDSRFGLAAPIISASLVNARVPFVYNSTDAGYVFRPDVVQECMSCSWPSDANTLAKRCAPELPPSECLPGCFVEHRFPIPSCATTGALGEPSALRNWRRPPASRGCAGRGQPVTLAE